MAATGFRTVCGLLLWALSWCHVRAFYIPGWSIKSYHQGEPIPLMVNKAYSDNTQLQYAYNDLPFVCPPTGQHNPGAGLFSGQSISLNLGEVLRGDRIVISDLELALLQDQECKLLCNREIDRRDMKWARELVRDGYVVEWIVDNLPGATSFVTVDKTRKYYAAGFKLGFTDTTSGKPRYYLNNHHTIVIRYRDAPGKAGGRGDKVIVGFEVYAKSIGSATRRNKDGCPADLQNIEQAFELYMAPNATTQDAAQALWSHSSYHPEIDVENLDDDATATVPFTYSVYFREDNTIEWDRRWDLYFVNQEEGSRIHWLAIINSFIICGLLTGIVLMILAKTVRTDIKAYKEARAEEGKLSFRKMAGSKSPRVSEKAPGLLDQSGKLDVEADDFSDDEALEDVTGWKLLHADVFRAPAFGWILAPLVGSGMQLLVMAVGLVALSALGVLNPSLRGGFISAGFGLFVFAGLFSGYFSARVYRTFGGQDFVKNALVTGVLFPGLAFGLLFILNLFVWAQISSTAIPFGTLLAILFVWLFIQLPLVYVGSRYGYHHGGAWEHPTKTSQISRQVPQQVWYMRRTRSVLLAGLIPFAVIFIELLFVFQSVWQDKSGYYYVFGFLAVVCVILTVTVAETTVVTVYMQLCSENHQWWWQSFLVGGGSAIWVFVYCVWYYFAKLHITGFISSLLFFTYSFMACLVYGLLTGTVGFLSAYAFVRRIYGAIKAD
ncbi:endomembrane protein 70 [Coniella lustricola]|uniref:Transmembrane 9 superfamily member n=1 Tax=Coniella lustricola TaxID=2025994 RepID=A0A2T3A330_9PEZI|nr:endomembrane protein 70 [Coniella lustricola]